LEEENTQLKLDLSSKQNSNNLEKASLEKLERDVKMLETLHDTLQNNSLREVIEEREKELSELFEKLLDKDKTLKDDRAKNENMEREILQLSSEKDKFEELKYYGTTQNDVVIALLHDEISAAESQLNHCRQVRRQTLQSWVFHSP